ncbi:MAG: hypothetical protein USCAAHI_01430 [Beijerinckiaceae bacterium]|nr:MAG: hypothetical protein USCAAHI_01430 [Beijerinckiaceae bacterium]
MASAGEKYVGSERGRRCRNKIVFPQAVLFPARRFGHQVKEASFFHRAQSNDLGLAAAIGRDMLNNRLDQLSPSMEHLCFRGNDCALSLGRGLMWSCRIKARNRAIGWLRPVLAFFLCPRYKIDD